MMPERVARAEENEPSVLQRAVAEIKSGNKAAARELLKRACRMDPANVNAWLWRATAAESPFEAVAHLQQVLKINPKNATALAWLATIRDAGREEQREAERQREARWMCPFCGQEAAQAPVKCSNCRAVPGLDLDAIRSSEGADERRLEVAIERLNGTRGAEGDFDAQCALAVAWLNLWNSAEALECLRRASGLRPEDSTVRDKIAALMGRRLVMVVDDSLTIRAVVGRMLERAGLRVVAVANGMEALTRLDEQTPDLVLLDVSMPVIDGYQLCRTIKNHPRTRRVPVVMLSGNDGFFDKVKGKMAGAESYLTKPFEPAGLMRAIGEYLH